MRLKWTRAALGDLRRLHAFLEPLDASAAARVARTLAKTPDILLDRPRIGLRLDEFDPREVRRILAGGYELRYEIQGDMIYVLRLWHTREDR
jgi:plasmid stabilization system protein ParE